MDAFSEAAVTELVGVFASQTGKTDCVLNILASRIHTHPGPTLVILPTLEMAESWSKDRLAPMLRDTPALRGRVRDARSRDSGNTVRHKQFPGGHLTASGANSPSSLAMRPIRDLFCDEIDAYGASAGTEGDPVKLADVRTRAFWNRKRVYISSPRTKGSSRLELLWQKSDQRLYFVPCAHCEKFQTLKWSQVHWEKDEQGEHRPETAAYACEHCGALWSDLERNLAVKAGEWRATRPFRGCAGFHINALAAPWDSCRLELLVEQWLEAQGNPELLKVFINTVLAEWWDIDVHGLNVDDTGLMARREALAEIGGRIAIPAPCALLTAGVDVQDNRFEVSIYAWGKGEESWCLGHEVVFGDPSALSTWDALDAFLLRPWPRAAGGVDFIRGAAVDTGGHHTQAAYDFCGARFRRPTPDGGQAFVFAIKGQKGSGELWPRQASKITTKVPLWPIRVDVGKEQVYGRLAIHEPSPGFVHFPSTLDRAFFKSLTAETCIASVNKKGFPVRTWQLKRGVTRNEALDCAVYAYAALCGLRANGFDLDAEVERLPSRPVFVPATAAPAGPGPAAQGTQRYDEDRSSWLGDTRDWLRR
jgi:phage terminase large subunit GpA-like protein